MCNNTKQLDDLIIKYKAKVSTLEYKIHHNVKQLSPSWYSMFGQWVIYSVAIRDLEELKECS